MTITNLTDLLDAINAADGTPDAFDLSALPTFGGDAPVDTTDIYSWDATHLLVGDGASDLTIVPRESL